MTDDARTRPPTRTWSAARGVFGAVIIGILAYTFAAGRTANGLNPFDYFGYFTNLTSLLTAVVFIALGLLGLAGRASPTWLGLGRAVLTACMIVVGVIYNTLVPGTGSAPPWVSVTLHGVVPVLVVLDWVLSSDRPVLRWSQLWLVLPYPLVWLVVVLLRGVTDGWVPYGFLLPSRGAVSLALHVLGLLISLVGAAVPVWWAGRFPGVAGRVPAE